MQRRARRAGMRCLATTLLPDVRLAAAPVASVRGTSAHALTSAGKGAPEVRDADWNEAGGPAREAPEGPRRERKCGGRGAALPRGGGRGPAARVRLRVRALRAGRRAGS